MLVIFPLSWAAANEIPEIEITSNIIKSRSTAKDLKVNQRLRHEHEDIILLQTIFVPTS